MNKFQSYMAKFIIPAALQLNFDMKIFQLALEK